MAIVNVRAGGRISAWYRGILLGLLAMTAALDTHRIASGQTGTSVVLGETVRRGSTSRVRVDLKAKGVLRPGLPPGKVVAEARLPKPRSLDVESRLVFSERVLDLDEDSAIAVEKDAVAKGEANRASTRGRPRKVVRHVIQAASAINGEVRAMSMVLRPEVSLLVAERRRQDGPVVVVSPSGPLTRSELEVVQAVGDPLGLADLLPDGAVGLGRHWRVGELAHRLSAATTRSRSMSWTPRSNRLTPTRLVSVSTDGSRDPGRVVRA